MRFGLSIIRGVIGTRNDPVTHNRWTFLCSGRDRLVPADLADNDFLDPGSLLLCPVEPGHA